MNFYSSQGVKGRPYRQHSTIMVAVVLSVPVSYLPGYERLFLLC